MKRDFPEQGVNLYKNNDNKINCKTQKLMMPYGGI